MSKFAKLFETEKFGQILVKIDKGEDESPEIRVYVSPPKLGICSWAAGYPDSDEGWDTAEKAFEEKFTPEFAESIAAGIFEQASHFVATE